MSFTVKGTNKSLVVINGDVVVETRISVAIPNYLKFIECRKYTPLGTTYSFFLQIINKRFKLLTIRP